MTTLRWSFGMRAMNFGTEREGRGGGEGRGGRGSLRIGIIRPFRLFWRSLSWSDCSTLTGTATSGQLLWSMYLC